ncbi:NADH-quinone oxidoreductase subunit J [Niveibacterium umoris]|uniref:NADH-quinone oxidoreductase subunit J n=1 Tax=Niveibacterium umoris TaxID=1193620 RepID=A0A840BKB0_9RHOO|nr:NADH-quinone oxidoreductase subunit J [Niveibacterium umoris]MBB4012052.1 NADH-quinone oxidoreductase subunit J [Niveibacterium umoris]
MEFTTVLFYVFAAITTVAGLRVITSRNPVNAALYLVLAFFNAAGIWMLLRAEFLAIALVLVYVGAVMVLFLFVVMMLDINLERIRQGFWSYLPLGLLIAAVLVGEMVVVVWGKWSGLEAMPMPAETALYSNTKSLAWLMFTDFAYPFELASFVLLVAMVAAISLTLRTRPGNKAIDPARQIIVKAADRLRIVRMQSEKAEMSRPVESDGSE